MQREGGIDWDDLRVVLTVSRAGSLAAAAKSLGVDRATVMRRLDGLEARLGAQLVRRARDGCSLTDAGATILGRLESIEDSVGALRASVSGVDRSLEGTVRVTAPEWIAYAVIAPALGTLRESHPGLCVELVTTNQVLNVTKREADIAFRNVRPTQASLIVRTVHDLAFAAYASRAGTARDALTYDASMSYMPGYKWLAESTPRVVMRVTETLPLVAAAKAGLGMAVLPCAVGDQEPALVRVPPGIVARFDAWLVTHRDLFRQARVRVVADFLALTFKRQARLLSGHSAARSPTKRARPASPSPLARTAGRARA